MLSSVLNSPRAIQTNIQIMRAFVRLRRFTLTYEALARKIGLLEKKYDQHFQVVFDALKGLMQSPEPKRRRIGFTARPE